MTTQTKKTNSINPILGITLLFGLAILSIPYGIVVVIFIALREYRLFRHLASNHRTIQWHEVEQHLAAGRGTLIIEQAQKQCLRLWWTPDDIPLLSPYPPPTFADLDFIMPDRATQPFVTWCFQRYLSPKSGTAFLSRPRGLKHPRGFVSPEFFTGIYPAARVIATILTHEPKRNA